MKKSAYIFAGITVFWLCAGILNAMDPAPSSEPKPVPATKYSLVTTVSLIYSMFAPGTITFVKKVYDLFCGRSCIAVIDSKGFCQLFKATNECLFASKFDGLPQPSLSNMFFYQDRNQENLLISYRNGSEKLYVWNYQDSLESCRTIDVGYNFCLHQKLDGNLIMQNTDDGTCSEINLEWRVVRKFYNLSKDVLSQKFLSNGDTVYVREEGVVVGSDDVKYGPATSKLSEEMFDVASLCPEERMSVTCIGSGKLLPIECYHQTVGGEIILGHDGGRVSIWAPQK